ncbi:hypothetical protein [Flavobacterium sp.]|uniref:hypothetical protein n=1 Tax=Flavobacterium sp. TaxID=239 RepID=UPI003526F566
MNKLTNYFGKYLSNPEFEQFRTENFPNATKYNSQLQFIRCKDSKLELGFTNERMIREGDSEKPLRGGKPVFTNFFIYDASEKVFDSLPFDVTFQDSLAEIEQKAGKPKDKRNIKNPFFGNVTSLFYHIDKVKIIFTFDNLQNKLTQIGVEQLKKEITE